jgi:hypothetical protein
MLIEPGHPAWTYMIACLYLDHPLALFGYTTSERYRCIIASAQIGWYTQEIEQFYRHYVGGYRHDPDGCVYCDERDLPQTPSDLLR